MQSQLPLACLDQSEKYAKEVIEENPTFVQQYKAGKGGVMGYLVGQVMVKSKGSCNPKLVNEALEKELKK